MNISAPGQNRVLCVCVRAGALHLTSWTSCEFRALRNTPNNEEEMIRRINTITLALSALTTQKKGPITTKSKTFVGCVSGTSLSHSLHTFFLRISNEAHRCVTNLLYVVFPSLSVRFFPLVFAFNSVPPRLKFGTPSPSVSLSHRCVENVEDDACVCARVLVDIKNPREVKRKGGRRARS